MKFERKPTSLIFTDFFFKEMLNTAILGTTECGAKNQKSFKYN